MVSTYEVHYDKDADFLEIFFGDPSECYAEEPEQGVFIRKDENTDEVKSIGIIGFKKRTSILQELLRKLNLAFPIEFNVVS